MKIDRGLRKSISLYKVDLRDSSPKSMVGGVPSSLQVKRVTSTELLGVEFLDKILNTQAKVELLLQINNK